MPENSGNVIGIQFLEIMVKNYSGIIGDPETDGLSRHMYIMGEVAQQLLDEGNLEQYGNASGIIEEWSDRSRKVWEKSKFLSFGRKLMLIVVI